MQLHELTGIIERASYLHERWTPAFEISKEPLSTHDTERRLSAWRRQAAGGDREHFQRRLDWDRLNGNAKSSLGSARLAERTPVPSWAELLRSVSPRAIALAGADLEQIEAEASYIDPSEPIPFEHVLCPFVDEAIERLRALSGGQPGLLSTPAWRTLERSLLWRLSATAGSSLLLEFSAERAAAGETTIDDERFRYRQFVRALLEDGLLKLFKDYAVLGRLLAQCAEQWTAFVRDFVDHLSSDYGDIAETLSTSGRPGLVATIGTGLSDLHNGGRSVLRVTFEDGTLCFYKPKNIDSEEVSDRLLTWLNGQSGLLDFHALKRVCRADHGWAEGLLPFGSENEQQAERFYRRTGQLLAVFYVMSANDCHFENIISHGEHPVLIDAETLLQPMANPLPSDPWNSSAAAAQALYHASVVRVGMLPRWEAGKNGRKFDVSTLGGADGDRGSIVRPAYIHANTDRMRFTMDKVEVRQQAVAGAERMFSANQRASAVEAGFTNMYRFLMTARTEVSNWLDNQEILKRLPIRYLVRSTFIYSGILANLLKPQNLKNGADLSLEVEVLARRFLYSSEKPQAWSIVSAEQQSLLQLDIPRFSCTSGECSLDLNGEQKLENFFSESGLQGAKKCLQNLSLEDLQLQVAYIRHSFQSGAAPAEVQPAACEKVTSLQPIAPNVALEEALRIAQSIQAAAIGNQQNGMAWITLCFNPEAQYWQLQPMGLRLYDGVCGLALFLSAIEHVTGGAGYRGTIDAALKILFHSNSKQVRNVVLREGAGLGFGVGSIIYGVLQSGLLLGDEDLARQGCSMTSWITPEFIQTDQKFDIIGGAAGLALVLIKVHEFNRDPAVLELAALCGQHLLKSRVEANGFRVWKTVGGKALAGFSHGAAGIAYALARLAEATGDGDYLEAALEALAYEETLYSHEDGNWPNLLVLRKDGTPANWNAWCHGAPGVGLARIGGIKTLSTPEVYRDIKRSLKCASDLTLGPLDHACCGTLGRLEVLLEAALKLGDNKALQQARILTSGVVERATRIGHYSIGTHTGLYVPSFFQGMAGVGYQLLRVAYPEKLPSVLSFQ